MQFLIFKCNFSIPVSARDAKGGVHEAIQSLLRHLLSGKGDSSERKRKNDELSVKSLISTHKRTKKTVNSDIIEEFESLQVSAPSDFDVRDCIARKAFFD